MSTKETNLIDLYSLKFKAVLSALRQEPLALWFLCLFFFFEYVRPQSLYPAIDVLPWAQLCLLVTMITAIMDKSVVWVSHPMNKLFVLLGLVMIISGFSSYYPGTSWDSMNIMVGWIIAYFLMITIVNSETRLILFILAYLLFNLKMAQHGGIGWAQRGFSFASYGLIGSPGWFRNSGEYAIQMLIYGSLAIAFVVSLKSYWGAIKKWVLFSAAILGYLAVMGASSRGSQLALAAIAIWFVLRYRNGVKGLIVLLVSFFLLLSLLPEEQLERFESMGEDNTSVQRLVYWEIGIEAAKEHPVLGIGYRNWMPYMSTLYPGGVGPLEKIEVSHSIYVEPAAELGFTGLALFLGMIVYAFITNSRTRKLTSNGKSPLLYHLSYGLDAGLIGFLVAGAFVTVFYYPFFWIQIAMIVTVHSVAKKVRDSSPLDDHT